MSDVTGVSGVIAYAVWCFRCQCFQMSSFSDVIGVSDCTIQEWQVPGGGI